MEKRPNILKLVHVTTSVEPWAMIPVYISLAGALVSIKLAPPAGMTRGAHVSRRQYHSTSTVTKKRKGEATAWNRRDIAIIACLQRQVLSAGRTHNARMLPCHPRLYGIKECICYFYSTQGIT